MPEDKTAGRIDCVSDILTAGFVQVPIVVLRDSKLSSGAKLIYGALLWYLWRGGTYPGQVAMAKEFGLSERSVRNHLSELENRSYLAVKRHGQGQPNTYTILCPWEQNPDRQILPVKAAKSAGQGGNTCRSCSREVVQDVTDDKLSHKAEHLAGEFLAAIGEQRPAKRRREKVVSTVNDLLAEGFSEPVLAEAIRLAGERGARGPELLPHLVGEAHTRLETRAATTARQRAIALAAEPGTDLIAVDLDVLARLPDSERARLEAECREHLPPGLSDAMAERVLPGMIAARLRGS